MKQFRQFFLGSTLEVLDGLRTELIKIDPAISGMRFETLPFKKVEEFDYRSIAEMINEDCPEIIWISLGAPKQEKFMRNLLPYLERGVMFGFGAIFNFYCGVSGRRRAPKWMIEHKLEWLFRLFNEPRKQVSRCCKIMARYPALYIREKRAVRLRRGTRIRPAGRV